MPRPPAKPDAPVPVPAGQGLVQAIVAVAVVLSAISTVLAVTWSAGVAP